MDKKKKKTKVLTKQSFDIQELLQLEKQVGLSVVGRSIPRIDAKEKVTGKLLYCAD
jgi:hypothetical protein